MNRVCEVGLSAVFCDAQWSGYPQSIYIATVVSLLSIGQAIIFTSWSPITQIAESVLHWSDGTVALVEFCFPVVMLVIGFPGAYLMETKGLRITVLLGSTCLMLGAAMRAIPVTDDSTFTILCNIGSVLVSLSMPAFPFSCSAITVTWFPAGTRAIATSTIVASSIFGTALGFLMDSGIVHTSPFGEIALNQSGNLTVGNSSFLQTDFGWRLIARDEIMQLMFAQFLLVFVGWFPSIVYFPEKPNNAPSVTADSERLEFFSGLKILARNKDFWLLLVSFSSTVGLVTMWQPVLGIALRPLNVTNQLCGWIGFLATVSTVPSMLIQTWLGEKCHSMKLVILVSQFCGAMLFLLYALMCQGVLPSNLVTVLIVVVFANAIALGSMPIYMELTCECCFPVYEGLSTITIIIGSTLVSIAFFVPMFFWPNSEFESEWISWSPFVAVLIAAILLVFVNEKYNRQLLDQEGNYSQLLEVKLAEKNDENTSLINTATK